MADQLPDNASTNLSYGFRRMCKLFPEAPEAYLYGVLMALRKGDPGDTETLTRQEGFKLAFAALLYRAAGWMHDDAKIRVVVAFDWYLTKFVSSVPDSEQGDLFWHLLFVGDKYVKAYGEDSFFDADSGKWMGEQVPFSLLSTNMYLHAVYLILMKRSREEMKDARAISEAVAEQAEAERTAPGREDIRYDVAGDDH